MPLENREVYQGEMKLGLENGSSRAREKRHRALNTSGESNGRLMCIISFDGRVGRGTGWETPFSRSECGMYMCSSFLLGATCDSGPSCSCSTNARLGRSHVGSK